MPSPPTTSEGHNTGTTRTSNQFNSLKNEETGLSLDDERVLNALGGELLSAAAFANISRIKALVKGGAPTWFQDPTSGWGPLHFAVGGDGGGISRNQQDVRVCVETLLEAGAPWNIGALRSKIIKT